MSIYQLKCKDTTILDTYIGKCKCLAKRINCHKHYSNPNSKLSHLKVYQVINNNGGYVNWDIIVLEEFEWEEELSRQKERYYYDLYKPSLNIKIPNTTPKETRYAYSQTPKCKQTRHIYKVEKINCLCGMVLSRGSMSEHLKRSRHLNKMELYMNNID